MSTHDMSAKPRAKQALGELCPKCLTDLWWVLKNKRVCVMCVRTHQGREYRDPTLEPARLRRYLERLQRDRQHERLQSDAPPRPFIIRFSSQLTDEEAWFAYKPKKVKAR